MIDILQWRASIGLWYYHVKSFILHKKTTRTNVQSSRKEQEQWNSRKKMYRNQSRKCKLWKLITQVFSSSETLLVSSISWTPVDNSSTSNTTMRYADWCGRLQTISLAVFLFFLLILSGDIELNPGPKTGNNYIILL